MNSPGGRRINTGFLFRPKLKLCSICHYPAILPRTSVIHFAKIDTETMKALFIEQTEGPPGKVQIVP